jgi:DNA-binding transcriptional MerR regulator
MEPDRLYGIGRVATSAKVSPSAIRRWEASGLIPPAMRLDETGRRVWRPAEVEAIRELARKRSAREGAAVPAA